MDMLNKLNTLKSVKMINVGPDNTHTFESAAVPTFSETIPNSWANDDSSHPGFVVQGVDDTPGNKAYLIHLEAAPGKERMIQKFMQDINNGVNKEPLTGPWFGLRYSKTTFFIFEAFPDAQARHTHDAGPGGQEFFSQSKLLKDALAYPAQLYRLDVMHGKFEVMLGKAITPIT